MRLKDEQLMTGHQSTTPASIYISNIDKKGVNSPGNVSKNVGNAKNRANTHENEDYDFWSMPNNESSAGKKRKDFVADSGLWVNDKDIDKSVFITDQKDKATKR